MALGHSHRALELGHHQVVLIGRRSTVVTSKRTLPARKFKYGVTFTGGHAGLAPRAGHQVLACAADWLSFGKDSQE
jgi:hypothetical protein